MCFRSLHLPILNLLTLVDVSPPPVLFEDVLVNVSLLYDTAPVRSDSRDGPVSVPPTVRVGATTNYSVVSVCVLETLSPLIDKASSDRQSWNQGSKRR